MIERLSVKNFRCFESLDLRKLSRFNIVVGENASGKTALLESLFFGAGGSPDLAFRLRVWRSAETLMQVSRTKESYESLWAELFFEQDASRTISAQVHGSEGNNYQIEVFYGGTSTLPLNGPGIAPKDSPALRLITFKGTDAAGKSFDVQPDITAAGITPASTGTSAPAMFFASTVRPSAVETAQRFSNLRKEYKHQALVNAVTKEFPIIKGLDIEVESGVSMVFADVVGRSRKLRLGMVSGGLDKLVSILIGIQSNSHGVVLVDEIENGLHYSKLPTVWSIIREFGHNNDTQVFVSTHSWECLKAVEGTLEKHVNEFSLIRTTLTNGKHSVEQFSGERLLSALRQNMEIR